jgi:galactokinase
MEPTQSRKSLIERTNLAFSAKFGTTPSHAITAPGRLNVIGEHVDYCGGIVLPAAIERWITASFRGTETGIVRIHDLKYDCFAEFDPNGAMQPESRSWLNYPKGVFAEFQKLGIRIPGFDLCFYSNVPTGGGLSSSAALEALFATVVEVLGETKLDCMEKALLCQRAEHTFAGVPCGIMDQAAVILSQAGSLLCLDCKDLSITPVPFQSETLGLMIIDSGVHHELATGAYRERREACEKAAASLGVEHLRDATPDQVRAHHFGDPVVALRALHVVTEIDRTRAAIACLRRDDFTTLGKLIQQSHHSLQYCFDVSCPELDFITRLCNAQPGVLGSRMMGGGFGGSAIALVALDAASTVAETVIDSYFRHFGIQASAFLTRPAAGVVCESLKPLKP